MFCRTRDEPRPPSVMRSINMVLVEGGHASSHALKRETRLDSGRYFNRPC